MNNRPHPPPTDRQLITIHDIIQLRLALERITKPSDTIYTAKTNLDSHILAFTASLIGEPSNG